MLVSLTDLLAYRVLKPNLARKRPCIEFTDLRIVDSCGGEFGFPSNHAANAAAIAFFAHLYFRRKFLTSSLVVFALLVGFSRVYLAAHYPLDVLAGYCLGLLTAFGVYVFGRRYFKVSPKVQN
jgi:undecaprenyl-diphosphatase